MVRQWQSYGFIERQGGKTCSFISVLSLAGHRSLEEGQRVEFVEVAGNKGPQADNVVPSDACWRTLPWEGGVFRPTKELSERIGRLFCLQSPDKVNAIDYPCRSWRQIDHRRQPHQPVPSTAWSLPETRQRPVLSG